MAIAPGSNLGRFEIVAPIGAGGMGAVYRARDPRLGREVAIKVLPQDYADDGDRLQRFEQEARAASALNHPNIITVHEVGREGTTPYIAMELVEGQTVRELVSQGRPPLRKLTAIGTQVAEGLAKAHAAGIVHRDLKPENLMVSTDGYVKILDFGLAKLVPPSSDVLSHGPTRPQIETDPGTVLGTVSYMSPEQAAGAPVDFRSDHFSLGSILYEMVTGRRAFQRATTVDTLSAILHEEPDSIERVRPEVPAPLRWIIARCLAKDPRERYAATLDLARDLSNVRDHISELSGAGSSVAGAAPSRSHRVGLALAVLALIGGFSTGLLVSERWSLVEPQSVARLSLSFSADVAPVLGEFPYFALSPDGTRLVYAGRAPGGRNRLYVRPLDRFEVTEIPGTDGALFPFFSPDGAWVGFWADKKLQKVSLAGGRPLILCDVDVLRGASWGADSTILFSPSGSTGLWRVSDTGGAPEEVTSPDRDRGEVTHRWPQILPGDAAVIFTANDLSGDYDRARIEVMRFESGERRTLVQGGADARYHSGHLLFLRAGALFAVPFDLDRLDVTGPAVPVLEGVALHPLAGFAHYSISTSGSLVYAPQDPKELDRKLVQVNRNGEETDLTDVLRPYWFVRISPDGQQIATGAGVPESEMWLYDITRNAWDRLVSESANWQPEWSPDGRRLAFCSNREGPFNPFWVAVDHSAPPERLVTTNTWTCPTSWSPDGTTLILDTQNPGTGFDILAVSLDGERDLRSVVETPANERAGRLSPDGRWMAYESNDSGRYEIYVLPYPGPGGRIQISTTGGRMPIWSGDGDEIFFINSDRLMVVPMETRTAFRAGLPQQLFVAPGIVAYDVASDEHFVMTRSPGTGTGGSDATHLLSVIFGWSEELTRRMERAGN